MSERRACVVIGQGRSTQRLPAHVPSGHEEEIRAFLRDFAKRHLRWVGAAVSTPCATPVGT